MTNCTKPWEFNKQDSGSEMDVSSTHFLESVSYDRRMYREDIQGSLAHAKMLLKVGLINESDLLRITSGLQEIEAEIMEHGDMWEGWKPELEDIHMCIEAALIDKTGEAGKKLHTGRSRNDQVVLDTLLWLQKAAKKIDAQLVELTQAFYRLAQHDGQIVMPSYTHLQRAQPIVVGGELLGWAEAFYKCQKRLTQLMCNHMESPLGTGAIAGSSLPLDRRYVSQLLGLSGITKNSIDSTASRDAVTDMLYSLAMIGMTMSRWAEQWIIYSTSEFNYIKIGSAYTTGSSMMPQKQNPDMLELIRGRCGNIYGQFFAMLTNLKGLPYGYNRDFQEDKRLLFTGYDIVSSCLGMTVDVVDSTRFREKQINEKLELGFLDSTMMAEYFVSQGVPFRTAHQVVGCLVKYCMDNGLTMLSELPIHVVDTICNEFHIVGMDLSDYYDWAGAKKAVTRYVTEGNCGKKGFEQQMVLWKKRLVL